MKILDQDLFASQAEILAPAKTSRKQLSEFQQGVVAEIPRLRRHAQILTRNSEDAEDLLQETLARAILNENRFELGTNIRAWLFAIMHNQQISNWRKGGTQKRTGVEISIDNCALLTKADQEDRLLFADVKRMLPKLSVEHQQVLVLIALMGLKYEEAARTQGVPVGTVRSRYSRAKQALCALMDGETLEEQSFGTEPSRPPRNALQGREKKGPAVDDKIR